jgi:hypothetical protein
MSVPGATPVLDKESFRQIIVSLSGLSDTAVIWDTDPRPFIGDQDRALVVLDLFSLRGEGWDETRSAYGPPGYPANAYVTTLYGNRTLVITIRVEEYDKSVEASEIIDSIRLGVHDVQVDLQFDGIRLAFSESSQSTRVKYIVDERVVNAAIADFMFLGAAQKVTSVIIDGTVGPNNRGAYITNVNDANNDIPGTLT